MRNDYICCCGVPEEEDHASHRRAFFASLLVVFIPLTALGFDLTWGTSWDTRPLQEILDDEYGVDDGIVFDGPSGAGSTVSITFASGVTRFGFYMNPNGAGDGGGAIHEPHDGDPQCLIYNITHLRGGVPTYVLAWEDLDYGSPVTPTYSWTARDNDFQDLVVEIQAISTVPIEQTTWGGVKALYR